MHLSAQHARNCRVFAQRARNVRVSAQRARIEIILAQSGCAPTGARISSARIRKEPESASEFGLAASTGGELVAESWGFEPQIPVAGYTRLAGEHLRPLGQLSGTALNMIAQPPPLAQGDYSNTVNRHDCAQQRHECSLTVRQRNTDAPDNGFGYHKDTLSVPCTAVGRARCTNAPEHQRAARSHAPHAVARRP